MIVNVGHDVIEKPPFFMKRGGADVIHISSRSAEVDPVYFPQIEVIGDIANAIWQMKEDIVPQGTWKLAPMLKARAAEVAHTAGIDNDQRCPIYPPYLVKTVRSVMPADGIICARQRCLQNLVRTQLPRAHAQHRVARQRLGDHGGGPALGDGLGHALSQP